LKKFSGSAKLSFSATFSGDSLSPTIDKEFRIKTTKC